MRATLAEKSQMNVPIQTDLSYHWVRLLPVFATSPGDCCLVKL